MSQNSQRVYIENRMIQQFCSAYPGLLVIFPNTDIKPPENVIYGDVAILGGKGFVAGGAGTQKVTKRYPGILQITFFAPDESGMAEVTQYIDIVTPIFELHRGRDDAGNVITFKVADFPNAGSINGWHPAIVKIPFHRDEVGPVS